MALLTRLTTFTPNTLIQSAQVNAELDQLVNLLSRVSNDKNLWVLYSHASEPPLTSEQQGAGPLQLWRLNGTEKARVNNDGSFQLPGLEISSTAPTLTLTDTNGEDFTVAADGDVLSINCLAGPINFVNFRGGSNDDVQFTRKVKIGVTGGTPGANTGLAIGHPEANSTGLLIAPSATPTLLNTSSGYSIQMQPTGTGLLIVGGSGVNEIWKDTTPSKATSFGMAVPGQAITDDFIIAGYNGSAWSQLKRVKQNSQIIGVAQNLTVDTSTVGNVGTGLDNLHSFNLPAGSLNANGDYLRVRYSGTFATNDDNKRIVFSFGGQTVGDTTLTDFDAGTWTIDIIYVRLSSTSVRATVLEAIGFLNFLNGAAGGSGVCAAANVDLTGLSNLNSNAMTMLVQAESATATNNNIVQNLSVIELTQIT